MAPRKKLIMPYTIDPNARGDEPKADPKTNGAPESLQRNPDGSQSKAVTDPNEGNPVAQANAAKTYAEREGAKKAAFDETGLTPAQVAAKRADNAAAVDKANLADANAAIAANKKAADGAVATGGTVFTGSATPTGALADQRIADNATNRAADDKTNAATYDTKPV